MSRLPQLVFCQDTHDGLENKRCRDISRPFFLCTLFHLQWVITLKKSKRSWLDLSSRPYGLFIGGGRSALPTPSGKSCPPPGRRKRRGTQPTNQNAQLRHFWSPRGVFFHVDRGWGKRTTSFSRGGEKRCGWGPFFAVDGLALARFFTLSQRHNPRQTLFFIAPIDVLPGLMGNAGYPFCSFSGASCTLHCMVVS